jgi:hypothetical protein
MKYTKIIELEIELNETKIHLYNFRSMLDKMRGNKGSSRGTPKNNDNTLSVRRPSRSNSARNRNS